MVLKISAAIEGDQKVDALFQRMIRGVTDYSEPLKEANRYMRGQISRNFNSEGTHMGKKWAALDPDYASQKNKSHPGKQILEKTGKMKRSFKSEVSSSRVTISNAAPYFKFHQSKRPRKKLPRRVMLDITVFQQAEIYRFFTKYLNKLTRNG